MHWHNNETANIVGVRAQAVYYQIVWRSVSVKTIEISATHEYFRNAYSLFAN